MRRRRSPRQAARGAARNAAPAAYRVGATSARSRCSFLISQEVTAIRGQPWQAASCSRRSSMPCPGTCSAHTGSLEQSAAVQSACCTWSPIRRASCTRPPKAPSASGLAASTPLPGLAFEAVRHAPREVRHRRFRARPLQLSPPPGTSRSAGCAGSSRRSTCPPGSLGSAARRPVLRRYRQFEPVDGDQRRTTPDGAADGEDCTETGLPWVRRLRW